MIPYRGDEHDYRHLRLMGDLGQVVFLVSVGGDGCHGNVTVVGVDICGWTELYFEGY